MEGQASGSSFRVLRIEKTLHEEIMSGSGLSGQVKRIYENGFDLMIEDGHLIHLREGKWLHCPFGGTLNKFPRRWITEGSLKEGDTLGREGDSLVFRSRGDCVILLNGCDLIDLRRILYPRPPEPQTLLFWIELLVDQIYKSNRVEGIAGVLTYLCQEMPIGFSSHGIEPNVWSRQAIGQIRKMFHSVATEDLEDFEKSWLKLLGLGPGLTPSADDFLVGFLAAHKVLCSSFSGKLEKTGATTELEGKTRALTVSSSAQFLVCALEGLFSESLYFVFDDLNKYVEFKSGENGLYSKDYGPKGIIDFLKWGHSSGADILTGVVFGLWTIVVSHNYFGKGELT